MPIKEIMYRSLLKKLVISASVAGFLFLSVEAASAQSVVTEVLRRMDAHNKALQSVQADVTMVKTNTQLDVSDTYSGSTSYLKSRGTMYARVDWKKPQEESMSVIGDSYELYQPRLNQVISGKVDRSKSGSSVGGALAFMSMSRAELSENYNVSYLGEEGVPGAARTWKLQLTPKRPTGYKSAELWVDSDGMPRQAKVVEQNNDTSVVSLTAIKKNQKINASIFRLNIPKNAKRLKA